MNINDKIEVVYNNKLHICEITSLEPFNIKVIEKLDEDKKTKIELTVAVALVKEQKMDLILQKLTELGVSRIIPVSMERSIVKLDKERFNKKKVRWESICKEASEQSKRTNIPIIEDIKSIKDLTKEDADLKLVASTKEKEKLLNYYLQSIEDCAKIIMVIGPEGGISDKEEDILVSNGYNRVSFGNLIFRVETATIYVASIINYISSRS
jgi:16S rRNA (uracil1498-N3)-methyltransferase